MANAEHLEILRGGVAAWNEWRQKDGSASRPELDGATLVHADLRGANLGRADMRSANLTEAALLRADLTGADLSDANLTDADLTGANLSLANLRKANMPNTNLRKADLAGADLSDADLTEANLTLANLSDADLTEANLKGANLKKANLSGTTLSAANLNETLLSRTLFCFTSLAAVSGLSACQHRGPSFLDYATLTASGPLPEVFLRGCGFSDDFIRSLPSFWNQPIQFYSCFISYSHADKFFARRLHDALQGQGIRCWLDEKQLLPGDHIHREIDEAVRLWDKVLLCCSEKSLTSWWVDKEVSKALKKEEQLWRERGKQVLSIIPLNLDGYMFRKDWQDWKKQHLSDRLAADFTGWENDNSKFEEQLALVIKALRADAGARQPPPRPRL